MTTSKVDTSGCFDGDFLGSPEALFLLPTHEVAVRRNGIEFLSEQPIPQWKEVTVELQSPCDQQTLRGTGVVVDCTGNRHTGYVVSLMFLDMAQESRRRLTNWTCPATP